MENPIVIASFDKEGQVVKVIRPEKNDRLSLSFLLSYLQDNKDLINKYLLTTGAILFRGFEINDRDDLLQVKQLFAGASNFDYVDGNSPRTKLSADVYTSTEYPKEFRISMHSELSYSNRWPGILFFFCKTPAEEGGETPLVDCRKILQQLDPELVDKFEKYGVKYTRYLSGTKGMGKTWMDTFETYDKQELEKYCRANDMEYSWEGNNLCLSQQGPGVAKHPVTQEKVWFNQANQFHPSGLPEDVYRGLKLIHSKNRHRFPQYAFFGNGEEIPEKYLWEITETHFEHAVKFQWENGDVLMLDNMLMAHGRMPFKGERKILVSMC